MIAPFSPLVEQAIELSAQWHDQTYRKGGWRDEPFEVAEEAGLRIPVMAHVTSVGVTVARAGWDDATIAAAFLHDALEDRDRSGRTLTAERLRMLMGRDVETLVVFVSERNRDATGRSRPWRVRKEEYLAQLAHAPDEAVAISIADKLHNLWCMNRALERGTDIFRNSSDRRALSAGPSEQRWFYRSVVNLARPRTDPRLKPVLDGLLEELRRFEHLTTDQK